MNSNNAVWSGRAEFHMAINVLTPVRLEFIYVVRSKFKDESRFLGTNIFLVLFPGLERIIGNFLASIERRVSFDLIQKILMQELFPYSARELKVSSVVE